MYYTFYGVNGGNHNRYIFLMGKVMNKLIGAESVYRNQLPLNRRALCNQFTVFHGKSSSITTNSGRGGETVCGLPQRFSWRMKKN